MADEAQTSTPTPVSESAPPPEASVIATPESDPTPSQADSKLLKSALDQEIDDLWSKAEGKTPKAETPPPPPADSTPDPVAETAKADPESKPAPEAPKTADPAEVERQVRDRIAAEERTRQQAEARIRADQQQRQAVEAYVGPESDYQAVNLAVRSAMAGDFSALDALDVVLPNGKRVSEVKGAKGLTEAEAANLLTAWDTARRYEDVVGDRKVQRIVDLWNESVVRVLADPDVDAAAVTKHANPDQQMEALRDSVRASVTKRLTEAHETAIKAKDAEIAKLNERVNSLVNERGNVASQRLAAGSATVDRPGQPASARTELPDPESLRRMSAEEFFKSNLNERLLRSIPGGTTRRAG